MGYAHVTVATRDVAATVQFFQETLGWEPVERPGSFTNKGAWLSVGDGQELHVVYVEDYEPSPFEAEFGRHVAVGYPEDAYDVLKERLRERGAEIMEAVIETPFERFFFRDPVNGIVFEVVPGS